MTNRREFIQSLTGISLYAGVVGAAKAALPAKKRPNLLFVFSDQQSYDMLGCYGNRQINTPNIDRLAAQGVLFNYCVSSSPSCTPYRGMLLSGQHPLRNGALTNDMQMLPGNGNYFAEVLRDAGYRTGYVGKWHLYGGDRNRPIPSGPFRYGFDDEFLSNNCTMVFDKEHAYYWDADGKRQLYGDWEPNGQTRQALHLIDQYAEAENPFALFISWHPPHNWQGIEKYPVPDELAKLYDPDTIRVRDNCADNAERREAYRGHMAMCTNLDTNFGLLMDKLKEKGVADNTIVVYTSDHGDMMMSHGYIGNKGRPQNESIRVPLVIRYPQKLTPRRSDLLVGTLDLMPTLLDLMDVRSPATCEGFNLAEAMIRGDDNAVESQPLFLFPHDWRGVYTRRYTYSFYVPTNSPSWWSGGPERWKTNPHMSPPQLNCLFDRQADPLEMHNLYDDPGSQALREKLHRQTLVWMEKFGDKGWSYPEIATRAVVPEDLVNDRRCALALPGGEGRLRGRPIDFMK